MSGSFLIYLIYFLVHISIKHDISIKKKIAIQNKKKSNSLFYFSLLETETRESVTL